MLPRLAKNVDVANIRFGNAKKLDGGGVIVDIAYEDDRNGLYLQTPAVLCPFGARPSTFGDKWTMDVEVPYVDQVSELALVIDQLDDKVVEGIAQNSAGWFGVPMSAEDVAASFSRSMRFGKDKVTGGVSKQYNPLLKLTMPKRYGKFMTQVYDLDKRPVQLCQVKSPATSEMTTNVEFKRARVVAIVQPCNIWMNNKKTGITWKVHQVKIAEAPADPAVSDHDPAGNNPTSAPAFVEDD